MSKKTQKICWSNISCSYLSIFALYTLKDVAIKIFCVFVSQCKWVSGIDIYEAEIKTNTKIWEVFAKKNWIHKSSLLIILLIIILVRREDFCYKLGFKKPGKAIFLNIVFWVWEKNCVKGKSCYKSSK